MIEITVEEGGVCFAVKVVPRASKSEIAGEIDGMLKIRLASPPVEGAANAELVRLLAKRLDVPKPSVEIISGQTSRTKRLRITGVSAAAVQGLLRD